MSQEKPITHKTHNKTEADGIQTGTMLMAKQLYQGFKNVFTYSAGMQQWVNNNLPAKPEYTFAGDFAIADWMEGKTGVLETYNRVKKEWLNNYKAFTDAAVAINMLAWAHYNLKKQGYEGRDIFIELYSNLYHQAVQDFYEQYEGDEKATSYFFQMTD